MKLEKMLDQASGLKFSKDQLFSQGENNETDYSIGVHCPRYQHVGACSR